MAVIWGPFPDFAPTAVLAHVVGVKHSWGKKTDFTTQSRIIYLCQGGRILVQETVSETHTINIIACNV